MKTPQATCHFCGETVVMLKGAYRRVTGWAQLREQGGTNSLSLMSEPEAWAHNGCVEREKQKVRGMGPQTEALF
jgi:hypothetical protein